MPVGQTTGDNTTRAGRRLRRGLTCRKSLRVEGGQRDIRTCIRLWSDRTLICVEYSVPPTISDNSDKDSDQTVRADM